MRKALLTVLLASACCAANAESGHKKDRYMDHDAERHQRVKECDNDASIGMTPDCQNAKAAESEIYAFGKPGQKWTSPDLTK